MNPDYKKYLSAHQYAVGDAFYWMKKNVPEIFKNVSNLRTIEGFIVGNHDYTKYQLDEAIPYENYFYGSSKSERVVNDFNEAWLKHIHRNGHHWQHWVLINDEPDAGTVALDIPDAYLIEMICDWWSFSFIKGDLYEIFNWYNDHKDHMILSENTRKKVEWILQVILARLEEQKAEAES